MGKPVVNEYQPSLTEWFSAIGEFTQSTAFREEDNKRNGRLEILYQTIGLPYERPQKFPASEVSKQSPEFARILEERGDELCAFRLVPLKEGLPKLRNRGMTIRECYEEWFVKQDINPEDYLVYVCPHCDELSWSGIFVVKPEMVFGEVILGMHSQLTQGNTTNQTVSFQYDFKDWYFSGEDEEAVRQIKRMVGMVLVESPESQEYLANQLQSHFTHNHLTGYFETTVWPEDVVYFIDYNRVLPNYIETPEKMTIGPVEEAGEETVRGMAAYPGTVQGTVVKVDAEAAGTVKFAKGDILVCDNTDVRYLPLMQKAGAIVTDRGGMLSHAAIIARELKKPCVVGTKKATKVFRDGDLVEVDGKAGILRKIA